MAVEIRLPGLGESIAEGTIVAWLKAEGDVVARDEDLVVVSTDKVETELPSPAAGTLLKIVAAEGETIDVGATIAVLGEAGEVFTLSKPKAAKPAVVGKAPRVATPRATPPLHNTLSDPDQRNASVRRTGDPKLFVSPAVRRIAEGAGRRPRCRRWLGPRWPHHPARHRDLHRRGWRRDRLRRTPRWLPDRRSHSMGRVRAPNRLPV